ncbi:MULTISPECIES: hypothetical protein [Tenebrionibacter/Tenebrionicola group]
MDKVEAHVKDALQRGRRLVCGGERPRARRLVLPAHGYRRRDA